jgi:amino acid transporter
MSSSQSEEPRKRAPLPAGYRQGIISAITVLLGFSLLFLRYYSFEAPGDWTIASTIAALLLALAILLELIALWRSLRIEDDDEPVYRITLLWFLASVGVLLASLLLATLATSHVFNL